MRHAATAAAALGLLAAGGCTTAPDAAARRIPPAASGAGRGAAGAPLAGDVIGGRHDRTEKIVGAGVGALARGAVGAYIDRQERELRAKTAGSGVDVVRDGDDIRLEIPAGIGFATDGYAVEPAARDMLDTIAQTLADYPQTIVDVYGHTDSTGSDAVNRPLSEKRALAVADYLGTRGVASARIAARGFGASRPVASNDTPEGRARNRRVEVRIVPLAAERG